MINTDTVVAMTPKQQRQYEKQQRRKKYADLAIQGTNNSSIASKRSVEVLYAKYLPKNLDIDKNKGPKEYFKYFVPKAPKRSPCINRGYWLRLHAIRSKIDSIVSGTQKKVVIINLGCGFDPLPFQLMDEENVGSNKYSKRFSFLDIDYDDLIQRKVEIINTTPELKKIIQAHDHEISGTIELKSRPYEAVACNLNHPSSFHDVLRSRGLFDPNIVKIFIAEVSLAYMKPDQADGIISLSGTLPSSHFLILEQLIPQGFYEPFGKQMLKHFTKNDSPLQSVLKYHTKKSQFERFNRLGFQYVNCGDMYQLWQSIDLDTRTLIQNIEPFDELEEFMFFAHHYAICHAVNYEYNFKNKFEEPTDINVTDLLEMQFTPLERSIDRRFGCAVKVDQNDNILYFGGCNPSRINETIVINPNTGGSTISSSINPPLERMSHTFNKRPGENTCILIGGRKGPNQGFADMWIFSNDQNTWQQGPDLPQARFRHCAHFLNRDQLLIAGGNTRDVPFLEYDLLTKKYSKFNISEPGLQSSLISAAMDYNLTTNKGVIIGGSIDDTNVSDTLYLFEIADHDILVSKKLSHPLLQRYGAKVLFLNENELLLAGGTCPDRLFGQDDTIIHVDLKDGSIKKIPIPSEIWKESSLFLVGFEMQLLSSHEVLFVGGGATCYGFGSVSNQGFRIKL